MISPFSDLIPKKLTDDSVDEAVKSVTNPSMPYYSRILVALFANEGNQLSDYTFDIDPSTSAQAPSPYALFHTSKTQDTITRVFQRHGGIHLETPLLMPKNAFQPLPPDTVTMLDPNGELLLLPYDLTLPFARYLARTPNIESLRRYTVNKVYRKRPGDGQPLQPRECDFDIVDSVSGNMLADAEVIKVVCEVFEAFGSVAERGYTIR